MKWKLLGFRVAFFSFVAWCALALYAVLIGPSSVMERGTGLWMLIALGLVVQGLTYVGERLLHPTRH